MSSLYIIVQNRSNFELLKCFSQMRYVYWYIIVEYLSIKFKEYIYLIYDCIFVKRVLVDH